MHNTCPRCFLFPFGGRKTFMTSRRSSPQGHSAQSALSPVCNVTHKHTHTPDTELDQGHGPEVRLEFRHDKSPLNLSS